MEIGSDGEDQNHPYTQPKSNAIPPVHPPDLRDPCMESLQVLEDIEGHKILSKIVNVFLCVR